MANGLDQRAASVPRLLNVGSPELRGAAGIGGKAENPGSSPKLQSDAIDQAVEDARQLPRCKTSDSNFSNVEMLTNECDGRPGFERCGGRATAEQQSGAAAEPTTWDLSVNVSAHPSNAPGAKKESGDNGGGGKKWWKPSMPFRGNRGSASSPSASGQMAGNDCTTITEDVDSLQRCNVRTPDSVDRTFHGPNKRPMAQRSPTSGRPPVPGRRNPCEPCMPGGIVEMDAEPISRPSSGQSALHRSSSVPAQARQQPSATPAVSDAVASFDRAEARSPGDIERRFHGPGRKAPSQSSPSMSRPSAPEPFRSPEDSFPGGIMELEAISSQACEGGGARSSSVPSRRVRGGQPSPTLVSPSGVAVGGVSALSSNVRGSASPTSESEVCPF